MPSYKLKYFNAKGRAEVVRLIFAQAGVKYEDVRIDLADWPSHKSEMPYYQVPILEEDGKVLAQSEAITMYLAKKYGLAGTNDWECAKVQEILGVMNDIITAAVPYFFEQDAAKKKQVMADFEKDKLLPIFKKLDEILAKNGAGYFVGKQLSAADLAMLHTFDKFGADFPHSLDGFSHLQQFQKKIATLPAIKKWLETRPKTSL